MCKLFCNRDIFQIIFLNCGICIILVYRSIFFFKKFNVKGCIRYKITAQNILFVEIVDFFRFHIICANVYDDIICANVYDDVTDFGILGFTKKLVNLNILRAKYYFSFKQKN